MGAIYEAKDERLGIIVAIKETFFTEINLRKAFEREARLLACLRHPGLPRVSDHFMESGGQFLVMEFIPGNDLGDMLEKEGRHFKVGEVIDWTKQLLDTLTYLHTQTPPIIHRDIKPQNLKIVGGNQIVLLDFGLAKGKPWQVSHPTSSGSIYGYTLGYAPLEQIQGVTTDPRSDLYSLAATIYHLLTLANPPDALSRATTVLSGRPDPLLPASKINAEVPSFLSTVLIEAMSLAPEQRPISAVRMQEMLRQALNDSSPVVPPHLTAVPQILENEYTCDHKTGNIQVITPFQTGIDTPAQTNITQTSKHLIQVSQRQLIKWKVITKQNIHGLTVLIKRKIKDLLVPPKFSLAFGINAFLVSSILIFIVMGFLLTRFANAPVNQATAPTQELYNVETKPEIDPRLLAIEERVSATSPEGKEIIEKIKAIKPIYKNNVATKCLGDMIEASKAQGRFNRIEPLGWEATKIKNGRWKIVFYYHNWPKLFLSTELEYIDSSKNLALLIGEGADEFWGLLQRKGE